MKFVVASYGTRGDVEPCVAVGRELLRRGHEVRMAVPPDLVGFAESAGLAAVAYGPDTQLWWGAHRDFWTRFFGNFWKIQDLIRLWREIGESGIRYWEQITTTLASLADGSDLLVTFLNFEPPAANVAEYYDIPLATLHISPVRANGQFLPFLPSSLGRCALTVYEWAGWRGLKKLDDAQRRQLGLPKATGPSPRRITERGSLEIQAYDEACFPGLAAEWAKWNGQRPFVGALTMELPTDADDEVASWIAAGTPPIFFGFGSTPVKSAADTLAMISAACAQLGERALVCSGWSDFSNVPHFENVKVVGTMNYAAAFPACRAVVHHGGAGTTAAGLRAGVPTLIFWTAPDQAIWAARVKRLKVGSGRRFSATTQKSLVADLRTILAPQYVARAREIATQMTKPAESVANAADLLESFAGLRSVDCGVVAGAPPLKARNLTLLPPARLNEQELTLTGPAAQSGTAASPVALFVLGVPRSGTSALTRVLSLCGATLPAGLAGADPRNPRGYWEPRASLHLNNTILRRHGSAVFDTSLRLQEEGGFDAEEKAACITKIGAFLSTLPAAPLVLIKDLQITLLSGVWFEAARLAGFDIAVVISVRHPQEVIASGAADFLASPELGSALWLKFNLLAERDTRGLPRVFVEYANLLGDWRREVKRISVALGIDLNTRDEGAIEEFLTPDLHRQRHCGPATEPFGTDWISVVYEALRAAARDEPWDQSALDRVFEAYRASERGFRTAFENSHRLHKLNRFIRPSYLKLRYEVLAMAHRRSGTWA